MLLMPAFSALIRIVPDPVATRSISNVSEGMVWPCACMIIGTRRTMPSRSGLIVNRPRPAAACSSTGTLRSRPGKSNMKRCGSSPSIASPGHRQRLVERGDFLRQAGFAEHDARASDGVGEDLVVARQRAQLGAGFLVEIAERVGRIGGIEPVGLRKHRVERDHDGAQPRQFGDEVGDPRPRPWPLAELFQALVVDIDDGDRPCGLLAGIDALEKVKGPDANFLDRSRIGDAKGCEPDQQRKAQQPGIADAPLEPPSQYPQSLHAVWISRIDGSGMLDSRERPLYRLPRIRYCRCRPDEE